MSTAHDLLEILYATSQENDELRARLEEVERQLAGANASLRTYQAERDAAVAALGSDEEPPRPTIMEENDNR